MYNYDFLDMLKLSFDQIWAGFAMFVPKLIIALILFILGWIIGMALSKVIEQIVKAIRLDRALEGAGLRDIVHRAGFTLNSGRFLGELVKWFVVFVFLVAAFDVLGLAQVNLFLREVVVAYIPQVISAVLILVITVLVAEFLRKIVVGSAKAAHLASANFLGTVTRWIIWVSGILAALSQVGIASAFIQTFFTGAILAIAVAIGLSFGLGGQDTARDALHKLRNELHNRS